MPNRIMNDSMCRSESLARLSWFTQCVFSRLIVLADDFGRYDARPAIIKGYGFPLHRDLSEDEIQTALKEIEEAGMLQLYEVGGKRFLQLTSWHKFQRLRNSKEKYPAPPGEKALSNDNVAATRRNSPQLAATRGESPPESESESESTPNPIQSNPNKNPNPNSNPNPKGAEEEVEEEFKRFWKAYPIHRGRSRALNEFKTVSVPVDTLLAALERQKQTINWQKDDGRWIPAPDKWLRDERWEDDIRDSDLVPVSRAEQYGEAEAPW